ncbi:MAG: polysaccharide biosynthesis C-terminal domain-containing protein [Flavobacteriaceae bacterium]|nr:polysaccharide biosynthesis C-terminal domain-containing protein [Flavobacteriaceae bacterium]
MDSNTLQKDKILNDSIWRLAFSLSWPIIIAMVLYGLNVVFDAILIGAFLNENALAAVVMSYPVVSLTMGIGSLIGVGAGSLLSILLGKNDIEQQSTLLGNVNVLCIALSLVYIVLAIVFGKTILQFMGAKGEILELATTYFNHTIFGSFFWVYGFATNMILRAEGKMKQAASIMGIGLVVNILISYVFIEVFNLGISGAAWGTNIGMLLYSFLGYYYLKSKYVSFPAQPNSLAYNKPTLKTILSLGMSSLFMVVMNLIQAMAVFKSVSQFGNAVDISVYGAAYRVYTLLLMPIAGFMRALQPVVGVNYGAGLHTRTKQAYFIFITISTLFILPVWILLMVYSNTILPTMISPDLLNNQDHINFQILLWAVPVIPFLFMTMNFYPSIGKGKPAVLLIVIRQIIFYVPAVLILPSMFGISSIYIASSVIEYVVAIISIIMVSKELRQLSVINLKPVSV